ncbi:oligosaccharide flippase family protein [Arcobacter lanthieri]|uniref:lipopolysaccharide biosynthesis protein n=1 Tax=Aliarcobacter lanthieri TaxID=1355374 RepID=UPI00192100D4|nr:oligosaccharide flippase family protein [Aliarcobacter lanthieri]MBL3520267.1 oligosaccharide flippase family protein [Aliarcobacter lanthieri]
MVHSSSFKNILKNAGILLTGNTGANILGLLSLSIFTHSQGAILFGYYILYLTYIEIVSKLFSFQTWQAFIKFATDFKEECNHNKFVMLLKYSFLIDLYTIIFAFILVFFLSFFAISFFEIPKEYQNILIFMSLTILFQIMDITTGVFRVYNKFKIQAKIVLYTSFIKLLLFSIVAIFYPTFEMFIYMTVISQFITMVLKYIYVKELLNKNDIKIKDIIKQKINFEYFKQIKILSFIVYNNFDISVRMFSRQFDIVILGKLFGAEVVGLYKIAKEIANIISKLIDPIYQTIYPEFARLLANNKRQEAKIIAIKISLITAITGFVFYLFFALLGELSIELVFGKEFKDAYNITLVYFLAVFIAMISLPLVPLLLSSSLAKEAFWNQLYATISYGIILYPLIYYYSAIGASIAYIVFYVVWILLTLKTIKNKKVFI